MAKHALTRNLEEESPVPYVRDLEKEMLEKINRLGIGPGGLGGRVTAMAVNIETYPTHIAGLPMAVNICCHVTVMRIALFNKRNRRKPWTDRSVYQ